MTYAEEWGKAEEKGKVDLVTMTIHSWDEEGQSLIGVVKAIQPFTGGSFDTEVNQYIIDTGEDIVSTVLGSSTDKQLAKIDIQGRMVRITYKGKKNLDDGRQVNNFRVEVRK